MTTLRALRSPIIIFLSLCCLVLLQIRNSHAQSDDFFKSRLEQLGTSNTDSSLIYLNKWEQSLTEGKNTDRLSFHLMAENFYHHAGDFPKRKTHLLKALTLEKDTLLLQQHKNALGMTLMNLGQFDSSLSVFQESVAYFKKHPDELGQAMAYNGLGNVLQNMGDNENAIKNFSLAAGIYTKRHDDLRLSKVYSNMGLSFRDLLEIQKAFDYRLLSYSHALKTGDEHEINFALMNMGSAHREMGNLDSAKYYLESALIYFEKNPDSRILVGCYNELGIICSEREDYQKAVEYYERSLEMIRAGSYNYALPGTLANYGTIAFYAGKYESGLEACREALPYAVNMKYLEGELSVCSCLYNNFKGLGLYDSALVYYERAQIIKDTLGNSELQKAVLEKELEMKHLTETEILKAENESKRKNDKELANAKIDRQTVWRNVLIVGCLMLLLALTVLLISRRNKRLSHQIVASEKEYLDNLLHNLVHEFRTPLTLIQGPVQELQKKDSENELLKIVDRNSHKMLDLVNQVLDFAKIKAGKLVVKNETTNLPIFLQDTIDIFRPTANNKSIAIKLEDRSNSQIVGIDSDKLYKVVSNLVSNAIKYTEKGGKIDVVLEGSSSLIKISVTDSGIGLKKEDQSRVFDKFYQVDATLTRKGEGTGLGLTFVQELVELMKGRIQVNSTLGKGSTFIVTLPVDRVAESLSKDIQPKKVDLDPSVTENSLSGEDHTSVLVIEDNADLRNYLNLLLGNEYRILLAEDGQIGVDMAIEHIPDFIISDIMMPNKDGFQVVEELKNDHRTEHIPIAVLTAKASFDSKLKGFSHGADVYLSKPFSSDELKMRIANQIKQQEKLRHRYQSKGGESPEALSEHPFIEKFKGLILEHLDKSLSADELAENLALSRSQLHRKLKALTGFSTTALVNQIKMEKAYQMILLKDLNISEIAYKLGYSDPAYFGKLFKKTFGKTPSDINTT